ncbi:hypothetical protein PG994_008532 [Apiospora phragmitis]|uniref:Uncharacterized protein n=1 Tax=Apiospora phragmitis TaxID=2905665 RepID=A0ABR1UJR9_9PEZI
MRFSSRQYQTVHVFNEVWDIVKEHFPNAVENGTFTQGTQETIPTELDFGFKFKTWDEMAADVAGQYLELLGKEKEQASVP